MPVNTQNRWVLNSAPAANTLATATKAAAGAGVKNVLIALSAAFVAGAVAPAAVNVTVLIRDGATGVGTILWSRVLSLPAVAGEHRGFDISGLRIDGTPNTALTVEFSAAGGANTFESVAAYGIQAE